MFEAWAMCWGRNLEINMVGVGGGYWRLVAASAWNWSKWGMRCVHELWCGWSRLPGNSAQTSPLTAQPSPAPSTTSWLHLHSCRPGLHWSLLHARTALVPTEGLPQNTDIIQTNFVFMLCMDNITIRESLLTSFPETTKSEWWNHGIMGTGIPDWGLLRYRKWVPNNCRRCSRHAAAVLSNKGVPQSWEM